MNDFWIAVSLFVLFVFVYFVLMILRPEWVGMSGKETKKILKDHEGDSGTKNKTPKI